MCAVTCTHDAPCHRNPSGDTSPSREHPSPLSPELSAARGAEGRGAAPTLVPVQDTRDSERFRAPLDRCSVGAAAEQLRAVIGQRHAQHLRSGPSAPALQHVLSPTFRTRIGRARTTIQGPRTTPSAAPLCTATRSTALHCTEASRTCPQPTSAVSPPSPSWPCGGLGRGLRGGRGCGHRQGHGGRGGSGGAPGRRHRRRGGSRQCLRAALSLPPPPAGPRVPCPKPRRAPSVPAAAARPFGIGCCKEAQALRKGAAVNVHSKDAPVAARRTH